MSGNEDCNQTDEGLLILDVHVYSKFAQVEAQFSKFYLTVKLAFSLPPYSKLRMKKKYEFYFPDNLFSLALVISSGSRFTF